MWASSRLLVVMLVFVAAGRLSAQGPKTPDDKKKPNAGVAKKDDLPPDGTVPIPATQTDVWVNTRAWLACLGASPPAGAAWNPYGVLAARAAAGHPGMGMADWEFAFDKCFPIWQKYLDRIQDGKRLPSVEGKELRELPAINLALIQAVDLSHLATLDMFKKSAEADDNVGFPKLHAKPAQFRGRIITVKGRITRVNKDDAPRYHQSDIQYVYSTSISGQFKDEPPFVVLFTELPAEVRYNEKLDMEVTFYGYFLANVVFVGDPKKREKDVTCPYLVGKTLVVNKIGPPPDTQSYAGNIIAWTVGGIVGIVVLGVLLNFWFRRGDRRIETQLAEVRDKHVPFSVEPAEPEPEAPPLAEPVPPPQQENGPPPAP